MGVGVEPLWLSPSPMHGAFEALELVPLVPPTCTIPWAVQGRGKSGQGGEYQVAEI